MTTAFELPDVAATERFAGKLSAALPEDRCGWTLLLQGNLGAGKTTLARAMLRRFGHAGPVPSPTYTLVESYELPDGLVYHVDLYRIADVDELEYLGWRDFCDGMVLLEWPERAPQLQQQADLQVSLAYAGGGRSATVTALSQRGETALERLVD